MNSKLPLRPNVCMLLFNRQGNLFLGERQGEPGIWQFPQGGVDSGQSLEANVIRELEEEIGVSAKDLKIIKKLDSIHEYEFLEPPNYARGKWRGQSQTFWLVEFLGEDSRIKLDAHEQELSAWRWASPDEVRQVAEPKRVPGYQGPLREFESWWRAEKDRRASYINPA